MRTKNVTVTPLPLRSELHNFENDCHRLWFGPDGPGPQTRLFRKSFNLDISQIRVQIDLFAESRYHLWFNGLYLGRGPVFHHPDQFPVDSYVIEPGRFRSSGNNVIAVLVHAPDVSMHNHVCSGAPGLMLRATLTDADGAVQTLVSDQSWRVTEKTGWRNDSPRRNWAIDYVEVFDMAGAPDGWQEPEFDDSSWESPTPHLAPTTIPSAQFVARPVPQLVYHYQKPTKFLGRYTIRDDARLIEPIASSGSLGKSIMDAAWEPAEDRSIEFSDNGFIVKALSPAEGAILCFDLGAQFVGQVVLDCDCPGPGTIDIGWSEVIEDHRPRLVRKGVGYVDRIHAAKGRLRWQPIQFSGMRYLVLTLRGFHGSVRVRELSLRASEPLVDWQGEFQSSDHRLTDIFKMCLRSLRVGTQEGQMDCPSREQAPYIADGVLTARWFAQLTGDLRHWKYIVREQFRRQSPDGLLRGAIFSGTNDPGVDYSLLAVIGVRDYLRFTDDLAMVDTLIEPCRRVLAFFDRHRSANGLCTWAFDQQKVSQNSARPWENRYDPVLPDFGDKDWFVLFIDHPGLGWHNKTEAGIDRRGVNAALNAFLIIAKCALGDLEASIGNHAAATEAQNDADHLANLVKESFFDHSKGLFADGIQKGRRLSQFSEQTNTLAVEARCCDDNTARAIFQKLLLSKDNTVARNGPYFWAYLFPQLSRLGLHKLAIDQTRDLWGAMLDGGASTLWETFLGDDLDTWCHPWAAAPSEFLLTNILGLPGINFDEHSILLRPRYDLLPEARGSIFTRCGLFQIQWKRVGNSVKISGVVPNGLEARVMDISGRPISLARQEWNCSIELLEMRNAGH
jgi:alpha-L-rhamnosidase